MVDISTRSGCRCVLREAKRRAKKSEKQCASAFQKYPPTLNFLDLGAGQLECERSRTKRANHNTEGKFCQNLGSRPTPYPIVKRFSSALDRKSTRLNSSHQIISYAVFCLKK